MWILFWLKSVCIIKAKIVGGGVMGIVMSGCCLGYY
jgi:hypothetical protein